MKRKFIILTMMLLTLLGGVKFNVLNAQTQTVTIGESGTISYGYFPMASNYNYSVSQQIYTKAEMNNGFAGIISDITLYVNALRDPKRNIEIYLFNTDKEVFESTSDWIDLPNENKVFDSEVDINYGTFTIDISDFTYTGNNLLLCMFDKTGKCPNYSPNEYIQYDTQGVKSALTKYLDDPNSLNNFAPSNIIVDGYYTGNQYDVYKKTKVTFTITPMVQEPSLTVSETSIALGDVRLGNYWTEKPVTATVEVAYENTDAPVVTSSDEFFTVSYDASSSPFNLTIGYDKTKTSKSEGTITITAGELEEEITVTANPYTPAQGDVWELAKEISLESGYTDNNVTGMYDDYILPDEAVDGNLNDAVYKFTLDKDALITATVEGTNPIVAIYDMNFNGEGGPSLDNNNTGVQSGPTGPTTFECGFEDVSSMDNFNYDLEAWSYYNANGVKGAKALKESSRIVTKDKYVITENSQLNLTFMPYEGEKVVVEISEDGSTFTQIGEDFVGEDFQYTTETIDLSGYKNKEVYFAVSVKDLAWQVYITNLTLTDGSAKSRGSEAQIDGVQYPAGTYYLVAAAEGEFTLNLRKVDYIAIDAPQVVGGGSTLNKYVGESVTLEWSTVEGVDGYRVYNGEDVLAELEGGEIDNYTTVLQDYNVTPGYTFYVTAYIGENESPKSEPIYVKVSGDVNINGTLTNGAGATLTFTGTDEFGGTQTYTPEVGNNGSYTIDGIKAGHYTMTASKFDYQDFSEEIDIVYSGVESVTLERAMVEKPAAGNAIYSVSMSETQSGATVRWSSNFSSANYNQKYNIYRKDVESGNVESIVKNQTLSNGWDGSYADATYSSLPDGKSYQYGVTAMVEGAGETVEVMREGFENNGYSLPQGWEKSGGTCGVTNYWGYYNTGSYGFYFYKGSRLTSPVIDLSAYSVAPIISFYCKNSTATNLNLYVKTSDSNWNLVAGFNSLGSFAKQSVTLPDSYKGKNIQIKFEYPDGDDGYSCIDDIEITVSLPAESKAVWSTPLKKGLNIFTGDGNWNDATKWSKGIPTAESEVLINGSVQITSDVKVKYLSMGSGYLTINSAASLTVTDELINTTSNRLIILDGGQLKQHSSDVKAVYSMNIVAPESWSSNDSQYNDGWQFIASPFTNSAISYFTYNAVYDLYRYNGSNQGEEWINHKDNEDAYTFETNFENGVGYLASRQNSGAVSLPGTLNGATSHTYTVSYNSEKPLANFHLLGNPFSFDMDWDNVDLVNVYDGFATIDPATGGYVKSVVSGVTTIPVGDGFFVEAIGETPSISYPAQSKSRGEEKIDYINVIATGAEGSNNLIVKFSGAEEKGFSKLENINPNIADIYVKNNGRQYSILGYDQDVEEIEVFFAAKEMGNYSISFDINGNFENVVLVDRLTGIETDMLLEDEYTFVASSNDNPNRFVVRLDNSQQTTDNSHFAYVNNGDIVIYDIEGNANIIIFDAMGRCVYNGESSEMTARIANSFNAGVYVIQKVDDNGVKVQKVIID